MNEQTKVTADHLRKQAILYVRQSTLHQVKENRESTALQYDLKRHAQELGWSVEQTVVIDKISENLLPPLPTGAGSSAW